MCCWNTWMSLYSLLHFFVYLISVCNNFQPKSILIWQVHCEITLAAGTHNGYKVGFYMNNYVGCLMWRILLCPFVFCCYVGHLESKERLRIQPAQLFNFGTHSTILHTVRNWHHRTFTCSWRWRSTLLVNNMQMMRTCSTLSWTGWIARWPSGSRRE